MLEYAQLTVSFQVCLYFMAGHCAFGSRCRYAHVHPDGTALDDDQQHSQGYGTQGQHALARQQAGEPVTSTDSTRVALGGSDAGGQRGVTTAVQPGCADAAWEDEGPGSSLAGSASAAQHRLIFSSRDPIATPRPLSRYDAAQEGVHLASDDQQHPHVDAVHDECYEQSNSSNPGAEHEPEHDPGQDDWPIGQYTWAEHAAGSCQAPNGVHAGAYEDDEWGEAGPSYEQWVAENGFSDDEGWVQHCVETVLQQERPGFTVDDCGYPVDDHGYGDGQHRSFDCDSYPDDVDDSDDNYQKLLVRRIEMLPSETLAFVLLGDLIDSHQLQQANIALLHAHGEVICPRGFGEISDRLLEAQLDGYETLLRGGSEQPACIALIMHLSPKVKFGTLRRPPLLSTMGWRCHRDLKR